MKTRWLNLASWLRSCWLKVPSWVRPAILFSLWVGVPLIAIEGWGVVPLVVLVFLGHLLFSLPEERLRSIVRAHGLFLAGYVFFFVIVLFPQFNEREGSELFYEASSQIIPVMLLTLMVETTWLSDPLMRYPGRMSVAALNMFLLAAGEYYALKGLVDPNWSEGQFAAVVVSMSSGMVAIVATAPARPARRPRLTAEQS